MRPAPRPKAGWTRWPTSAGATWPARTTPSVGGGHAHLIVTLDAADLTPPGTESPVDPTTRADPAPDGEPWRAGTSAGPGGTLCWVGPISAATARRIGCDADVTYVSVDTDGGAQVIRRERRFFTAAQKAMIARDGDRCCVPLLRPSHHLGRRTPHHLLGPRRTDPHQHRALPCAAHHPMFHEGGWTLHRTPDGRYLIERNGRVIGPEPHPPGHNKPHRHPRTLG